MIKKIFRKKKKMCIICRNEIKADIKYLDCSGCQEIKEIPVINGLQDLYCNNCPLLTSVPVIDGLRELSCSNCPLLRSIPCINGLQILNCNNSLLTNIPLIEGLKNLYCFGCPLLYIPFKLAKTIQYYNVKSKMIGLKIKQKCKYIREKIKIKIFLKDEIFPLIKYSLSEYDYRMNERLIMNCIFQYL